MEKKYRLLKDLPDVLKDQLFTKDDEFIYCDIYKNQQDSMRTKYRYYIDWVENHPDWFEEVKELEFKVGDWSAYEFEGTKYLFKIEKFKDDTVYRATNYAMCSIKNLVPVTNEEIKSHLIKEAEKRGYGVDIRTEWGVISRGFKHDYQPSKDHFYYHNIRVYEQGEWAEIIKEEKIIINGYALVKSGLLRKFGCANFSKEQFDKILQFNNFDQYVNFTDQPLNRKIKSIILDSGVTIDIETINKIVQD